MEIRSESRIAHPLDAVFHAYRDHLPDAAKFIPDIREVIVRKREEFEGRVSLHNEWVGDRELPAIAQGFLKPEHLRWDDFATWHTEGTWCDWTIKTRAFTDRVHCKGKNQLVADGPTRTFVRLTGELRIDVIELPGIPSFIAKRIAPQLEKFIVSLITPNLEQTNRGIEAYLDSKR